MTSTQIAAKAYADGLNDTVDYTADPVNYDNAVEVYFYYGNAAAGQIKDNLLASAPVFVAKADSANKTAIKYVAPAPVYTTKYSVELFAHDKGVAHSVAVTYPAYMQAEFFKVFKADTVDGNVLFNNFEEIDLHDDEVKGQFYCKNYGNLSKLPVIIIAIKSDMDGVDYTWDISYTKQGGADKRLDITPSIKGDLVELKGYNFISGYDIYALQVTEDMVQYGADMKKVDLDPSGNAIYDIDLCIWVEEVESEGSAEVILPN